ncbi:MAG: hypothetical protein ACOVNU_10765 [Candidatus Kapaibacteriota bacterium]|jgi:hypothetical protein
MFTQKSKKVLLFAILLISLFGFNLNKSEAQCPTGWSFQNFIININGCNYSVNVCYKCAPTALDATEFDILSPLDPINPSCTQTWTEDQVINYAYNQVRQRIYLTSLCEARPCDQTPKSRIKFVQYACWEYYRDSNGNLHLQACVNDAKCEVEYEVCNNGSALEWTIFSTNWVASTTPTCSYPNSTIPIPQDNNTSSGCYRISTPCDTQE